MVAFSPDCRVLITEGLALTPLDQPGFRDRRVAFLRCASLAARWVKDQRRGPGRLWLVPVSSIELSPLTEWLWGQLGLTVRDS